MYTLFCSDEGQQERNNSQHTENSEGFGPCSCIVTEKFNQRQGNQVDQQGSCGCQKVTENT